MCNLSQQRCDSHWFRATDQAKHSVQLDLRNKQRSSEPDGSKFSTIDCLVDRVLTHAERRRRLPDRESKAGRHGVAQNLAEKGPSAMLPSSPVGTPRSRTAVAV